MKKQSMNRAMKFLFSLLFSFLLLSPFAVFAYPQSANMCYGQCTAYKFVWQGDFCFDLFMDQCSTGGKDIVKQTIELTKDLISAATKGELSTLGVENAFKAMFVCKPLIEDCTVPQQQACSSTCAVDPNYYAPNLTVGSPFGSYSLQGVFYNEEEKTLTFKVTNNGRGYASDIDVTASWGHTRNRDGLVSGGGVLFTEKIPELLYLGARTGAPKTPTDYVTDFLIEESNFAKYLQSFKSDADNYYVPPAWYKTIPFTAPDGEFTKVILNVDQNKMIPESSEGDNTYILEIDKLPLRAYLEFDQLKPQRQNNSLTDYLISFDLKNTGEESANATVKLYKGKYSGSAQPVKEWQPMVVTGKSLVHYDDFLTLDVSAGSDNCNTFQTYTLRTIDNDNRAVTKEFNIPLYAGSVSGRVEDLFGKPVAGALATTDAGQSATTSKSGYYHLKGINKLGKVNLTVTHPEFSQAETREVEIKFEPDAKTFDCRVNGLTFTGENFVLKDQDVLFTVSLKDVFGKSVKGHVVAGNKDFRLEKDVDGSAPLDALQPGEYLFTVSAGGYKTIAQTVSAVPNDQNLEFVLEPLAGRPYDGGLSLQAPKLLWQLDLGTEIFSRVAATKDGNRMIIYTTKNKADTGKLYFIDAGTGQQIKTVPAKATGGQSEACLDTSYDGNTTALLVHVGGFGLASGTKNTLTLYNSNGEQFASTDFDRGGSVSGCAVSPDGFYLLAPKLMNKGLYQYTRRDIEGIDSDQAKGYGGSTYFLHGNGLIAACNGGAECAMTIAEQELVRYAGTASNDRVIDSNFNDAVVAFAGFDKLFLYRGGAKAFEKDVNASKEEPSVSVTMGGQYVAYTYNEPKVHNAEFKIVDASGADQTPSYDKDPNEDVIFVHANDKGIFYLAKDGKTLKYYQVGSYATEYKPPVLPSDQAQTTSDHISVYENGSFSSAGTIGYADLLSRKIYLADQTVVLQMPSGQGSLTIKKDSLFSVNGNQEPVLIKGQLTAEFNSPVSVYALKFDRYDLGLFQSKLDSLIDGTLPAGEYVIVKNIHTKYVLESDTDGIIVRALAGDLEISHNQTKYPLENGKTFSLDHEGKVKIGRSYGQLVIFLIVLLIAAGLAALAVLYFRNKARKKSAGA